MSMSTFISDLPGPQEEYPDYEDQENCEQLEHREQIEHPEHIEHRERREHIDHDYEENFANEDTYIIKKKGSYDLKNELNLENLLLFCLLFIATLPQLNEMIRKVLGLFLGSGYSHGFVTVIKCILLVILFIIVKKFVLV